MAELSRNEAGVTLPPERPDRCWVVVMWNTTVCEVYAKALSVIAGSLVFQLSDRDHNLVEAYAPGAWITVEGGRVR